jgi:tol-pal system protein YbgF
MPRYLSTLSGLVLCASPFFASSAFAQEYIDLEQERLRNQSSAQSVDAQSVDAQSGDAQPVEPSGDQTYRGDALSETQSPAATGAASNVGEMYYQLQLLQEEVMALRGLVEEQAYQMRQLKQQSLERYVDIDKRLSETPEAGATTPGKVAPPGATVQEQAGEGEAYRSAYSLVRSQKFKGAISAFVQFLQDFPAGKYAPNAHYWLGELYLVIQPAELESARREFTLLLEQYPQNGKIPDALYKLGKVYFDKGNREKAREYFERVINEFGDGNSSAVKLARDFLSENY